MMSDHPSQSLRGRDLLCFSHDWGGDPLSKNHLMRLLARHNRVLWVNSIGYRTPTASRTDAARAFHKLKQAASPIREVEPNIFVLSPLAIPAYRQPWVRSLNRWCLRLQVQRAMRRLGFARPINFVFNPAAAIIAGTLGEESIVYYCVDEYAAFSGVSAESLARLEAQLLAKADLVITSSKLLHDAKRRENPNAILVRHGVDYDHFRKALLPETIVPAEVARLPRPILGYFGLIARDWVDLDLMAEVAGRFPTASIVMLGKVAMDVAPLARLPNVHFFGRKPYETLPSYCKAFDVALIPFPIHPVTLNANPLKAREYLAAGLPVISTAIPEVQILNLCRIGEDAESFIGHIGAALSDPGPSVARSESVRDQSWEARLGEIEAHVLRLGKMEQPPAVSLELSIAA